MLYKPEHVESIQIGRKTQTRRLWIDKKTGKISKKPRAKVGNIQKCKTKMLSRKYFALVKILRTWTEELGNISEEDAIKEGYSGKTTYLKAFFEINKIIGDAKRKEVYHSLIWCVEFRRLTREELEEYLFADLKTIAQILPYEDKCPDCGHVSNISYTIYKRNVVGLHLCCDKEFEI